MANITSSCGRAWQAVSNGVFQGNIPIEYSVPLLIIQMTLVLLLTRTVALLFNPLRQPRVVAEIIGGILLGPSALGRNKKYMQMIFPADSMTLLDTMSNIGLLYFLFMVGLEVDLKEIKRNGKAALSMAFLGIAIPFLATIGVASLVQNQLLPPNNVSLGPLVVFMGVPLSITAFPVLARIMAERKLLKTEVGRLVLPAAAINDVCAWVLLAVGVALSGSSKNPLTPALVLISGMVFGAFMLILGRRLMSWVAKRATKEDSISEIYLSITLVGVLVSGFTTDAIGIHALFGAFILGLVVPKEGKFAEMVIKKIEDFVTILLIPLFFASSGLKTNFDAMNSASSLGFLLLFLSTAALGKISGTVVVARLRGNSNYRENLTLGFLMNTKGLAELIVMNIGKDLKVLDDQLFAILVLTCLLTTFMTTPVVVALYKPARNPVKYTNRKLPNSIDDELRIMTCFHGTRNIPSILNFIHAIAIASASKVGMKKVKKKVAVRLFVLHLMELSERPSAIMLATKNKNKKSVDPKFIAFQSLAELSRDVVLKTETIISNLADMHEDLCLAAENKRVNLIILPFSMLNQSHSGFNQRLFSKPPCSLAVLLDHKSNFNFRDSNSHHDHTISNLQLAVFFLGGPDDREALTLGSRLANESTFTLFLIRFMPVKQTDHLVVNLLPEANNYPFEKEEASDEEAIEHYKSSLVGHNYEEVITENPIEAIESIARSAKFCLVLVGHGKHPPSFISNLPQSSPELGAIGEALANLSSPDEGMTLVKTLPSIVVVKQYYPTLTQCASLSLSPPS